MKLIKRIFAGTSAMALLFSSCINSGFTAVAATTENEENRWAFNVPAEWTNSCADWVDASDDVTVYYKVRENYSLDWGSYNDALEWNESINLEDTRPEGRQIKFWAVKNGNLLGESEPTRFLYDKTLPNDFNAWVDKSTEFYKIISNDYIYDNQSGLKIVYYSVSEEYKTIDEIENAVNSGKCRKAEPRQNANGFYIDCTKDMTGQNVYIYVIDNAGNIRTKSVYVENYMDTSAPDLKVNGINKDKWVNLATRKKEWKIEAYGAKIYYKVFNPETDEEPVDISEFDWGKYTDSDAEIWSDNAEIPEGECYIHFWAAYDSPEKEVAEETREYKYDNTAPGSFTVKPNLIKGDYDRKTNTQIPPKLTIIGKGLYDSCSGINTDSIKCMVSDNNNYPYEKNIENINITNNEDGTFDFEIDFSTETNLRNVNVVFYVYDNAGNPTASQLGGLDFDPTAPVICDIGITDNCTISDADIINPISFGGEKTGTKWNSVYFNDSEYYLRVKITEEDLSRIVVTVDGDEKNEILFSADGKSTQGKAWKSLGEGQTKDYFIKLSDLELSTDTNHTIMIKACDKQNTSSPCRLSVKDGDKETEYTLLYDADENKDSVVIPEPSEEPVSDNGVNYYGADSADKNIGFSISDDNGLSEYSIKVNETPLVTTNLSDGMLTSGTYTTTTVVNVTDADGSAVTSIITLTKTETYYIPVKETSDQLDLGKAPFADENGIPVDGKYDIEVNAKDLAGNEKTETYSFIIDTTAPVIDRCEYKYNKSLIKYLSFGLFGKETYEISIHAFDPDAGEGVSGIGIDNEDNESVVLEWNSKKYSGKYNPETKMYDFGALPLGCSDIPTIIITDKLGNTAVYCMESADEASPVIILGDGKGKIPLVLETDVPKSGIITSESFNVPENDEDELKVYKQAFADGHTEWWYPNDFKYQITAQDDGSGLYSVYINENGEQRAEELKYGDSGFGKYYYEKAKNPENAKGEEVSASAYTGKAAFSYAVTEEGKYELFTYAVDNAQNTNQDKPESAQSFTVYLDKTKPQITEFVFGEETDDLETVERLPYGFFFTDDTEVKVYVNDPGTVSAGIQTIHLWLDGIEGSFDQDVKLDIVSASEGQYNADEKYAVFTIAKGFKGQVYAEVIDNVGHSSGIINANGNIVEDPEFHKNIASITVTPDENAEPKDAAGVPIYNHSIPVTVTVEDSFSGIGRIEWSITDDNEAGVIEVDANGNFRNASGEAQIIEDTIERDENLITKLQFTVVIDSNTNGNVLHIMFTDRSGNISRYDPVYSIDTTEPVISASLSNTNVVNSYYYNADQTVTVSITERNFNPSAVVVRVNNEVQTVHWNEQNPSVTTDATVHTGTFTISNDGVYSFTISYTDMAGNMGTSYSQSTFVIDKTSPKISNNFESFGSPDNDSIYYNISQMDKAKAEITVVETNFSAGSMNVAVYYQPAGSTHSDNYANWSNYYYSADWEDGENDTHTLVIPFTEDGVYKIVMSPVDLAGNPGNFKKGENSQYPSKTAIFEADYTAPVIVSRNNNFVEEDDVKFYDIYDFDRREEDSPTVVFQDTNIDRIECDGKKYTPVYTNGREIGEIEPDDISSKSTESVTDAYIPQMIYTLDDFTADGVYSAKLTAYDKAGNKSELNDNTYVRMVDPTVDVLAYIENSNREKLEGWYSFEDENGPISKQPSSFSDLSIVVFSKTNNTHIYLVDKATNTPTDTNITDTEDAVFDNGMYQVGAYRYVLPGEYFEKNYTADVDTNLYLRVENNEKTLDLGEMYIDNTDPECKVPEHFRDWGWFSGSGEQTISFENVSEVLDIKETVAYVDGETVYLSNIAEDKSSVFSYDEKNNTLSLTLEPGSHRVGLLLVDRAGNSKSITEVQHLAIGNYRIWMGLGIGFGAILLIVLIVFVIKRIKRGRLV